MRASGTCRRKSSSRASASAPSEPGAEREQPLAVARDMAALSRALDAEPATFAVADFLLRHPEWRHVVRRAQIAARHPYAEIRDNLIDADMRPIDLLRSKLAFFGASRFDPRSDRWLRISLFAGEPFPEEIARGKRSRRMTELSLNEVESLAAKVGRGAGFSWGLAEEIGRGARQLAQGGLPWAEALLALAETAEALQAPSPAQAEQWRERQSETASTARCAPFAPPRC